MAKPLPPWHQDPLSWILLALLSFVFCTLIVLLIGTERLGKLSPSDWASWVQAIGSIAAIVAAAWIASSQHRRDVERQRQAVFEYSIRSYTLCSAAVIDAWKAARVVAMFEGNDLEWLKLVDSFRLAYKAVIDCFGFDPPVSALAPLIRARGALAQINELLSRRRATLEWSETKTVNSWNEGVQLAAEELGQLLDALGAPRNPWPGR